MKLKDFDKIFSVNPTLQRLCRWAKATDGRHIALQGLRASAQSVAIAEMLRHTDKNILLVADDGDGAGYAYFDIVQLLGNERVAFFPAFYKHNHKSGATIAENEILRTDSLNKISGKKPCIIVSYPEALVKRKWLPHLTS